MAKWAKFYQSLYAKLVTEALGSGIPQYISHVNIMLCCSVYAKILAVCGLVLVSAAGNILVILAVARHRAMR